MALCRGAFHNLPARFLNAGSSGGSTGPAGVVGVPGDKAHRSAPEPPTALRGTAVTRPLLSRAPEQEQGGQEAGPSAPVGRRQRGPWQKGRPVSGEDGWVAGEPENSVMHKSERTEARCLPLPLPLPLSLSLSLSVPGVWIRPLLAFGDQRKARLAWLLLGSRERAGSCGAGEPASKSAFGGQASPLVGGVFCRKRSLSEFDTQGREMSLSVRMPWLPAWACALPGRTLRGGQLETATRRDAPGGRRPPPDQGRRGSPSFPSPHCRCGRLTGRGRMTLTPKANTGKRARPQPA